MLLGVSGSVSLMGTIKTSFLFYFFLLIGQGVLLDYFAKATPITFSLATRITVLLDVDAERGRTDVILGLKALLNRLRAWSHAAFHPPA